MNIRRAHWLLISLPVIALFIAACTMQSGGGGSHKGWKSDDLVKALSNPSRPQADRDRDADRKPAQLMTYYGVKQGDTALDLIAAGGFLTEVLSITVGPSGKVYSQNPAMLANGPAGKALTDRLANNRLPNVVRIDGDLQTAAIPEGSVDFAITSQNFHDVYNRDPAIAQAFLKSVYTVLKPGGVFALIDHVGNDNADNKALHRVPKHFAVESAKAAGFVVESESAILAHPTDDHTKVVFDPSVRGKTDQFALLLRKPKK